MTISAATSPYVPLSPLADRSPAGFQQAAGQPGRSLAAGATAARPVADPWSDDMDVEKGTLGGYGQPASEDLTFSDLVDLINPLHHIPGVSHVYRALTGDTIKPAVKVAGGALFGGPIGVIVGAAAAVAEAALGDPLGRIADRAFGTGSTSQPAAPPIAQPAGRPAVVVAAAAAAEPAAVRLADSGAATTLLAEAPPYAAVEAPSGPVEIGPVEIGAAAEATLAALMAQSTAHLPDSRLPAGRGGAGQGGEGAISPLPTVERGLPLRQALASPSVDPRPGMGKDIRTYLAEMPQRPASRPRAEPERVRDAPAPAPTMAAAPVTEPVEAGPGPAAPGVARPGSQQVPPWFADRVLQNLERYGTGAGAGAGRERAGSDAAAG